MVDQPDNKISAQKPYLADSIDYNRVEERASQGYFRTFWSAYKGHVRGMLAGVLIGGVVGGAIGLALVPTLAATLAAGAVVAAAAGVGALMGAQAYGDAGSAAASRAAGLAERHARILDPVHKGQELSALDDKLMMDGRKHHFQFPEDRDKGKFFNWKSGTVGALVAAGVGALLAKTGILAGSALFGSAALGGSAVAVTVAGAALAFGALGLTFGIDRSNLKAIFNQVDANTRGKFHNGDRGPDMGRAQYANMENAEALAKHRLNRQESTSILEKEYQDKIFAGAVKGMFRGFAGGVVAGTVIGAAVGALAFAAASAAGVTAALGLGEMGLAAGSMLAAKLFAGAGALYGMKVFTDSGREAGAESMSRAIDNEFERNQELRERGITPPAPKPQEKHFLNLKAALIMGVVGAAIGALAPGALGALGLAAKASVLAGPALAASSLVGGLIGAMYGVGSDTLKGLSRISDYVYDRTYLVPDADGAQPYASTSKDVQKQPAPEASVVTQDDMNAMQQRLQQRPQKSFEQAVLAAPQQPSVSPSL